MAAALLVAVPGRAEAEGPEPGGVVFGAWSVRQVHGLSGETGSAGGGESAHGSAAGGDVAGGTGETDGVDEAAALASEAEARFAAGATDEALALWRRAYALLPRSIGYAQRRAAVALAIAGAEEAAFRGSGDPARLRAGIAALDTYLAGLEPTDDENRAGVEGRRAALSDMLDRAAAPQGPTPLPGVAPGRRGIDRRAGLAAAGLGAAAVVAGVVAIAGAVASRGAERALARATGRPCSGIDPADPCGSDATREALKAEALADGLRANRVAVIGATAAGVMLAAGAVALIVGGIRGRAPVRAESRGAGLLVRF